MRLWHLALLLALLMSISAEGALTDVRPPELVSFDIHPTQFSANELPRTIVFTAHLTDDFSGLSDGSRTPQLSHASFFSATWSREIQINFTPSASGGNLVSGGATDGVYVGELRLDKSFEEGVYTLDHLYLVDNMGNSRILGLSDLNDKQFPTTFAIEWELLSQQALIILLPGLFFVILIFIITLGVSDDKPGIMPTGLAGLSRICRGDDGAVSASKVQFFLWTMVALFAYVVIFIDRIKLHGEFMPPTQIPQNLMVAMGLSVTTAMTGDYVDVKYGTARIGSQVKSKAGLFTSDEGEPDLSKIQMMAWTVVAILVFLVGVIYSIWWEQTPAQLPDIDSSLIALMGIGQGAFIGNKLIPKAAKPAQRPEETPASRQSIEAAPDGQAAGGTSPDRL